MADPAASTAQLAALTALAEAALGQWNGPFTAMTLVKYRENAVFSVIDANGQRLALRVHRGGYHAAAVLDSELAWMAALGEAGMAVPAVVPTRDGRRSALVATSDVPDGRHVDLLHWLSGRPLAAEEADPGFDAPRAEALYRALGETAARVHEHSRRWTPPAGFARPSWDLEGLVGDRPLWGPFWELAALSTEQAALVRAVRAALREDLVAFDRHPGVYGMIHGDMLADNVVVDDEAIKLIDFDDAGWGWYLFDLATILYFRIDHPLFDVMQRALLDGYRTVRVPDWQVADLPMFLMLRSLTYLGWDHTRRETETARLQTPMDIAQSCRLAELYLRNRATPVAAE